MTARPLVAPEPGSAVAPRRQIDTSEFRKRAVKNIEVCGPYPGPCVLQLAKHDIPALCDEIDRLRAGAVVPQCPGGFAHADDCAYDSCPIHAGAVAPRCVCKGPYHETSCPHQEYDMQAHSEAPRVGLEDIRGRAQRQVYHGRLCHSDRRALLEEVDRGRKLIAGLEQVIAEGTGMERQAGYAAGLQRAAELCEKRAKKWENFATDDYAQGRLNMAEDIAGDIRAELKGGGT